MSLSSDLMALSAAEYLEREEREVKTTAATYFPPSRDSFTVNAYRCYGVHKEPLEAILLRRNLSRTAAEVEGTCHKSPVSRLKSNLEERCPWNWNWGHGIRMGSAAETVPKKDGERESGGWRLGLSEVAARQDVWPRPLREKVGLARGDGRLERGHPPARCNHLSQFVAMASKTTSQRRIPGLK